MSTLLKGAFLPISRRVIMINIIPCEAAALAVLKATTFGKLENHKKLREISDGK